MNKNTVSFEIKDNEMAEVLRHCKDGEKLDDLVYRLLMEYLNQLKFASADEQNLITLDTRLKRMETMLFNIGNRIPLSYH